MNIQAIFMVAAIFFGVASFLTFMWAVDENRYISKVRGGPFIVPLSFFAVSLITAVIAAGLS